MKDSGLIDHLPLISELDKSDLSVEISEVIRNRDGETKVDLNSQKLTTLRMSSFIIIY